MMVENVWDGERFRGGVGTIFGSWGESKSG